MKKFTLVIDAIVYKKNKAYGYQEYLFNLLNYFFENRSLLLFNKIIIVCEKSEEQDFYKYHNLFEIKSYKASNILSRILIQNSFPYLMKLNCDDTILFTGNYSSVFKTCRHILVIHDLLYLRKELMSNIFMRFHRLIFIPLSLKNADSIIAISNFTKNDIIKSFNFCEKKINVIYNYFNFRKFLNFENFELGKIGLNAKYILSISSMLKHKNVITMLRAFQIFAQKNIDTNLLLVGNMHYMYKEDKEFLFALPTKVRSRIIIAENISHYELSNLYKNCECFVLSSRFEGLGMPVVEALHFNAPLIVSDIAVFREILEENALYFPPDNFQTLSEILISCKYKLLQPSNRVKILEKFNEENTSLKYIEILNMNFIKY